MGGSEQDLVVAAEAYVGVLGSERLIEFPVTALDRVGVPVWATWWVAPTGLSTSSTSGLGYGSTELRARVGALGECVEHVCSRQALLGKPTESGSLRQMRSTHGADRVVDPRLLGLPAGSAYDDDRPLAWWPLSRLHDARVSDEQVWAPVEYVASAVADLPAPAPGGWLIMPVTNGLGAGATLQQAVAHGVLEILQRDGNGLSFRALDTQRVLDLDGVSDAETLRTLELLRGAGVEVLAKLAATDFGMANIDVVGMAPHDDLLSASACGEAVHPDRETALRKAVLEFASARARKQLMHGPLDAVRAIAPPAIVAQMSQVDSDQEEARVLAAMVEWLCLPQTEWEPLLRATVLGQIDTIRFTDLPTTATDQNTLLGEVEGRLRGEGFDILVADLSPRDAAGAHAVKVLIPGLEVETVAYARIGERNVARLLDMGRDDLVRVGQCPPGRVSVHLTAEAEQRLGGPAWLDRAALDAVPGRLFPLYREPGWQTAQSALRSAAQSPMRM